MIFLGTPFTPKLELVFTLALQLVPLEETLVAAVPLVFVVPTLPMLFVVLTLRVLLLLYFVNALEEVEAEFVVAVELRQLALEPLAPTPGFRGGEIAR